MKPDEFWTPYPAATYSRKEPSFTQVMRPGDYSPCNFHGSVWVPYNYWIMHGLAKYGFVSAAEELGERTFELFRSNPVPREWYNSETGEGYGADPFWGFSGLAPFMSLELEYGVDPNALEAGDLREKFDTIRERLGLL